MPSEAFDVIPFEDIKDNWTKLGSGSFGKVYRGKYLGVDVAIKEVLPSDEYDVGKYFEREWRLMKECRHPNIVAYMGLSRAPEPDNRIFIVSEFIENGNLRGYIHDKAKPFPWRLRISFATDIARALAYLHARKCIHRDLKGENLLVTSNCRLKITDFGFARIAARNNEELKRMTYCGTDSYMSPEILLGEEFDLPTDVYSLGIIYCEIAARKLADDTTFKRYPPNFKIDTSEIHRLASPGCPPEFLSLCIDCLAEDPHKRPNTRDILARLDRIEQWVLANSKDEGDHVGSIKFATGGKRPAPPPRIPSFGEGVGQSIRHPSSSSDSDDELMEAVSALSKITVPGHSSWSDGHEPLIDHSRDHTTSSTYSTSVVRRSSHQNTPPPALSSILTIRPSADPSTAPDVIHTDTPVEQKSSVGLGNSMMSIASDDSYHTAPRNQSSVVSSAAATQGGSTIKTLKTLDEAPIPRFHRFTLIKTGGGKSKRNSIDPKGAITPPHHEPGWNPLGFFSDGLFGAKCDVCTKRLGRGQIYECDDCGLRAHIRCGEDAPRDCGIPLSRVQSNGHHFSPPKSPPKFPKSLKTLS